jgi:hypothetical protein
VVGELTVLEESGAVVLGVLVVAAPPPVTTTSWGASPFVSRLEKSFSALPWSKSSTRGAVTAALVRAKLSGAPARTTLVTSSRTQLSRANGAETASGLPISGAVVKVTTCSSQPRSATARTTTPAPLARLACRRRPT